tara:strand:- start:326 stop:583 length:258 start_codon:yes stop_codon:yes gene_type:complete
MRSVTVFTYWIGIAVVIAAALGVLIMLAILVNPLTSTLAGVIVIALGVTMTGARRGPRLPPELLFYAALALVPLFIALALIVAVT